MLFFTTKLFYIWMLLLPFSWVIAYYTNFIAIDKLIAPVLLVLGMFLTLQTTQKRINNIIVLIALSAMLLVVKHISFVGMGSLYQALMWEDGIKIGYFLVPLLCINNREQFDRAAWLVVIISIIGCLTVFLVAVDLLTLPAERFEISRLGEGGLRKSIGLFRSYGDMAQYVTFAILWLVVAPTMSLKNKHIYRYARLVMFVSVFLGLAGAQSRNLLLSVVLGLFMLWVFRYLDGKSRALKKLLSLAIIWSAAIMLFFIVMFSDEIINLVSHIGGGLAGKTVTTRLEQYGFAINLFKQQLLFGADASMYASFSVQIEYIHNMWLRLAAHGGLVTLLVVIALFARIFTAIRKTAYIADSRPVAVILSSYFVVMLFSSMFYVAMGEMYWVLLGIATSFAYIEVSAADKGDGFEQKNHEKRKAGNTAGGRILSYKK